MLSTQFFRVRLLLRLTKPARLHASHYATLYALLASAYGRARGTEPIMPDGVLLDAPEQCQIHLATDARYAFGATFLDRDAADATQRLEQLVDGLRQIGRQAPPNQPALGGNFEVVLVEDLVASHRWSPQRRLTPIPTEHLADEAERLRPLSQLTLDFSSPLRTHVSKHRKAPGHAYFDRNHFDAGLFLSRLQRRLEQLGLSPSSAGNRGTNGISQGSPSEATIVQNHLVWLDMTYGPRQKREALGGALGRLTLGQISAGEKQWLLYGQYARVGGNTRFGFGAYRIEELGPTPFACSRADRPLALALSGPSLDRAAAAYDLDSGVAQRTADAMLAGQYTPQPHTRLEITSAQTGKSRTLAIPGRVDRALQRAVLDWLAPALDLFWEESSLAFRKGLGRHRAAGRVADAFRRGYRWALKADFASFFDTVDHQELAARLRAYVADEPMVEAVMRWVEAGAPAPGRGLPTGAPLSPVLANLLLDQFDEQVTAAGGFLVRYADDFLVLFRQQAEAEGIFDTATKAAAALRLRLNEDKTRWCDLREPFDFLGYRFAQRGEWESEPLGRPCLLEELGWRESRRPAVEPSDRLPGESDVEIRETQATAIAGPGVKQLDQQGRQLIIRYDDDRAPTSLPLENLRSLIVLGRPNLSRQALDALARQGVAMALGDDAGRPWFQWFHEEVLEDADVVGRQTACSLDETWRLDIARKLVAAKLVNYAALADRFRGPRDDLITAKKLSRLARRARQAASVDELLGIEGSGAALWYGRLDERLPPPFEFARRVAPHADDPVNVLLNFAQTVLHRQLVQVIRQARMTPAVGILHRPRSGHAALASDLQEPLRHLMDRAVLRTLAKLTLRDFHDGGDSDFPLRLSARASRELLAQVHRVLAIGCHGRGQAGPRPYRYQAVRMAQSLRRHLLDPAQPLEVFEHP